MKAEGLGLHWRLSNWRGLFERTWEKPLILAIYIVHIYTVYTGRMVWDVIIQRLHANGPIMPNGAHFAHLQPLLHSLKAIPGSVRACTEIGGWCVLRHVTKREFDRIGGPLTLPSLYC